MTRAQLDLLLTYIDLQADAQVAQRSGYEATAEVARAADVRRQLEATIEEPIA